MPNSLLFTRYLITENYFKIENLPQHRGFV